jgi:mono/diheme cytochrome c family protein
MSVNRNTTIVFPGLFLMIAIAFVSCKRDSLSPGVEYMPDMYRSQALKAYVNYDNPDSMTARMPVAGTIPYSSNPQKKYDNMPYAYANTVEGYEAAGSELKNPVPLTDVTLEEGKVLYSKYCIMCHGDAGKGDGTLIQRDKFPPPPAYNGPQLKDLSEGKMFHTVTYGKGLMGSHASQVSKTERWKIIHYVQKLQAQE